MTSKGIDAGHNEERGHEMLSKVKTIAIAARLRTERPRIRTKYVLESYLRTTYTYNALLLPAMEKSRL